MRLRWNDWKGVSEGTGGPGAPIAALPWTRRRIANFISDPNGGIYNAAGTLYQWGPWAQRLPGKHEARRGRHRGALQPADRALRCRRGRWHLRRSGNARRGLRAMDDSVSREHDAWRASDGDTVRIADRALCRRSERRRLHHCRYSGYDLGPVGLRVRRTHHARRRSHCRALRSADRALRRRSEWRRLHHCRHPGYRLGPVGASCPREAPCPERRSPRSPSASASRSSLPTGMAVSTRLWARLMPAGAGGSACGMVPPSQEAGSASSLFPGTTASTPYS